MLYSFRLTTPRRARPARCTGGSMAITRRTVVQAFGGAMAAPFVGGALAQEGTLKISHQFPGGSINEGDFRDRLCRRFAADIEKRSNGALKAAVYPGSSLMKTNAQFSAMRKGALDISLYPLSYAGGEVPETNIGLMPALVPSYEVGSAWKTAEVGKMLAKTLDEKGIVVLSWIWQAGGVEQEKFATDAAKADDKIAAEVYAKAGAKVFDLDEATVRKWQAIARDTAWKDYADRGETSAALLKAAQKLLA